MATPVSRPRGRIWSPSLQRCVPPAVPRSSRVRSTAPHASGTDRARPELARLLARLRRGDSLVVVRIDRLARSLAHLLEVIDRLQAVGAHFRSLSDPIDTASPTGRLVIQVIGAIAEFERNLIAERTKAGLAVAKARGKTLGNPRLIAGDPEVRRALIEGQRRTRLA